ncbi:MAG: hypothetical protein ABJE10_14945 [bacterium]
MTSILRALLLIGSAGACGGQALVPEPAPGELISAQSQSAPNRNRDLITKEELANPSISGLTVLDAVKNLRPHFLTVRGVNTLPARDANGNQMVDQEAGKVHASVDGQKIVPIEELNGIHASSVVEIRFLSPSAAMQRFGGSAREGPVILVITM